MTDEAKTAEQPAAQPAETDGDTWEGGATERTQERLDAEQRLETLYPDETGAAPEPEPKPEPKPETKPAETPKPVAAEPGEALWSNEDLQTFTALQTEAQQLQADMAQFAQLKAQDIDQLAGNDKGKAAAIRKDLDEWEQNLAARHQALSQQAEGLQQKATARQKEQYKARLHEEAKKLNAAFPDLDKKTLRAYLIEQGFTEKEIKSSSDSRVVTMAEKARRYDAMMANGGPKPKKIPLKKGAKAKAPEDDVIPSMARGADVFQKQAAMSALYPERKPGGRKRALSDDAAEILYGGTG